LTWATDFSKGFAAPAPRFDGVRRLHQLLLVEAIEATRLGHDRSSAEALEASWRLLIALRGRPEMIAQLAAAAMAGDQNGVLRRLPRAGSEWKARVTGWDYRRAFLQSLELEAWVFFRSLPQQSDLQEMPTIYVRLAAADYAVRLAETAIDLKGQEPC